MVSGAWPASKPRPRPLVLVILDGFGERAERDDNAVRLARRPRLAALFARYPHGLIGTSGPDVGLPPGQMGNSEVGHLNFGAGRIAMMDISRIDNAVARRLARARTRSSPTRIAQAKRGRRAAAPARARARTAACTRRSTQLCALIDAAHAGGVPVVVHAFLDGRDVQPGTAPGYVAELEKHLAGKGVIGTVGGRYWGMDRDNRWERVAEGVRRDRARATAPRHASAVAAASRRRIAAGKTDEFVEPFVVGDYAGVDVGEGRGAALQLPPRSRARAHARARGRRVRRVPREADGAPFLGRYGCMTTYDASLGLARSRSRRRPTRTSSPRSSRAPGSRSSAARRPRSTRT